MIFTILLFLILRVRNHLLLDIRLIKNSIKIIISLITMIFGCYVLNEMILDNIENLKFLLKLASLLIIIVSSTIIYLGMIFMLKVLTISDLKGYIRKNE